MRDLTLEEVPEFTRKHHSYSEIVDVFDAIAKQKVVNALNNAERQGKELARTEA
jgi:hypothetical protein